MAASILSVPARQSPALWRQSWDIVTDMAVKLVPGGHPHHALAEAAANAAREGGFAPDEIESITRLAARRDAR